MITDLINQKVTMSMAEYKSMQKQIEDTVDMSIDLTYKLIESEKNHIKSNKKHRNTLIIVNAVLIICLARIVLQ